jgi:hypothetical protein
LGIRIRIVAGWKQCIHFWCCSWSKRAKHSPHIGICWQGSYSCVAGFSVHIRQASSIVSKRGIIGRCDDDRDEDEFIRFTGGRSLLRFVAPEECVSMNRIKTKKN